MDVRHVTMLLGIFRVLPIPLAAFLGMYDFCFIAILLVVLPYILFMSRKVVWTNEHAVMFLYALVAFIAFLLFPTGRGLQIGWGMYVMPALLFFCLPQLSKYDGFLDKDVNVWGCILAVQLIVSVVYLFVKLGTNFDLHLNANIYWARSNAIATMLEMPILWFFSKQIFTSGLKKTFYQYAFFICCLALFATASRAGLITVVFSLLVFNKMIGKKITKIVVLTCCIVVVYALVSEHLVDRLFNLLDRSNIDRIYLWLQSIELIIKQPWLGYGPGNVDLYADIIDRKTIMPGPHNLILEIMLHVGIIGFVLFAAVIWLLTKRSYRYFKKEHNPVFFVIIGASMFHSMVEPTFLSGTYSYMFWYFMSLLIVKTQVSKPLRHL